MDHFPTSSKLINHLLTTQVSSYECVFFICYVFFYESVITLKKKKRRTYTKFKSNVQIHSIKGRNNKNHSSEFKNELWSGKHQILLAKSDCTT